MGFLGPQQGILLVLIRSHFTALAHKNLLYALLIRIFVAHSAQQMPVAMGNNKLSRNSADSGPLSAV